MVSTRKLVDSREDQEILEELIDAAKPPWPDEPAFRGLHYLLATPFRYPPLAHGSRFAARTERSLWYGSTTRRTAFAENAYYRWLFLEGTTADLGVVQVDLSVFRVAIATARGVDLTRPPFDGHRAAIAAPDRYTESQALGVAMRAAGVAAFRYPSARDAGRGTNVGLFTPAAFASGRPELSETWHCAASAERIEYVKRDVFEARSHAFLRAEFLVEGELPSPAA